MIDLLFGLAAVVLLVLAGFQVGRDKNLSLEWFGVACLVVVLAVIPAIRLLS